MPIYTGVDPRWYEYQQQRKDAAFSDLLQAMKYRQEKRYRSDAEMFNTFLENPDLIGSDSYNAWAEKAGRDFDIGKQLLPELKATRDASNARIAEQIGKSLFGEVERTATWHEDAPGRIRDQSPDLLEATGRPDLPPNRYRNLAELAPNDFLSALGMMKDFGVNADEMSGEVDPTFMRNMDAETRSMAALVAEGKMSMDDLLNRVKVKAGAKMNAGQQQAHEDRVAAQQSLEQHRDRTAEATERYRQETLDIRRANAAKGGRGGRATPTTTKEAHYQSLVAAGVVDDRKPNKKRGEIKPNEREGLTAPAGKQMASVLAIYERLAVDKKLPEDGFLPPSYFEPKGIKEMLRVATLSHNGDKQGAERDLLDFYDKWIGYAQGVYSVEEAMAASRKLGKGPGK